MMLKKVLLKDVPQDTNFIGCYMYKGQVWSITYMIIGNQLTRYSESIDAFEVEEEKFDCEYYIIG